MSNEDESHDYKSLFAVSETHELTVSSKRTVKHDSTVYETRWLDERDENKTLISRFRTWTNRSMKPPYRRQLGWERYSLSGDLLDREVRYSRRKSMAYLH